MPNREERQRHGNTKAAREGNRMSVEWMSWVFKHSPYDGKAQVIHLSLADHADEESGTCWPSQESIARKARCSVEYVRRTLQRMEGDGLVQVVRESSGRGHPKMYRLLRTTPNTVGGFSGEEETPNSEHGNPQLQLVEPPTPPSKEPSKNHQGTVISMPDRFDEFWQAFGYKNGKGPARKAWDDAVKIADPQEIIDGAARYRAWLDSQPNPPQQKWAQGWLNDHRWEDELPAARVVAQTRQDRKRQQDEALFRKLQEQDNNRDRKAIGS